MAVAARTVCMGPCRVPLPKGKEGNPGGEAEEKGCVCGATRGDDCGS